MGETRSWSSLLVHILVIALCLTAFGFAIAAERRRSTVLNLPKRVEGSIVTDINNSTYCTYDSDISTGYGVGAFLFLLSGQSLLMGVTKCMCFGQPLAPGGSRAWSIIYFVSSWITFIIAESCLIAGATKNAYHTKYRHMIYAGSWTCDSLRKGVFISGAVFVVLTMTLNVYFYMYYTKSTRQAAKKTNKATANVGMAGYA
ncbi:hypothetical protein TRIUR3_23096 [Triticum urartu]|uniref:Fiber protein Fb34 n=4 Tax=Triticinae TaxID=1648030 RepID=A0A9R1BQ56_TRITD|nr:hypothetical protein TRIUR3_23096 [Triticum urartu]VAI76897.1 unnamed protein product [Triticum turgidum subsp. durum]